MKTRRDMLAAGTALIAAKTLLATAARAHASPPTAPNDALPYDYLVVEARQGIDGVGGGIGAGPGGAGSTALFLKFLETDGIAAVTAAGGEVLGYFTPLIGWSSEQLAILIRWKGDATDRERALATIVRHPSVRRIERTSLAATLRPTDQAYPKLGGIYTHRWFVLRRSDLAEFVELSGAAWPQFERDFEAAVDGLFRAQETAEEQQRGVVRMLLNTHYASHAVWENSRTPAPGVAQKFKRRNDITLTTRVASLAFTPLAGK